MTLPQKLFGFDGRLRRRDWWGLGLTCGVTWLVILFIVRSMTGLWSLPVFAGPNGYIAFIIVDFAISLPFFWVQMALNTKRAHDLGQSGVAVVLLQGVWIIGLYLPAHWISGLPAPGLHFILFGIQLLLGLASLVYAVVLGFIGGSPLANEYGVSPKAEHRPDAPEPDTA